ncbi:MAG TPA: TIGR02996 domain-containing protein, partial [Pirellulales bacterium]
MLPESPQPEAAFLAAIDVDPLDDARRLIYADWLDEQGEPAAAEFLRAELDLANASPAADDLAPRRERLWQAWATVDRRRFHEFTQPRRMRANPTSYPAGWPVKSVADLLVFNGLAIDAGYANLPALPVDVLRGEFQYLDLDRPPERASQETPCTDDFNAIEKELQRLDRTLPAECRAFLSAPWLEHRSTALINLTLDAEARFSSAYCYQLHAPRTPSQVVVEPNGCVRIPVGFLEGAVAPHCEIYLHPSGAHCITSTEQFGPFGSNSPEGSPPLLNFLTQDRRFAAPSLEAFVYRLRMETHVIVQYYRTSASTPTEYDCQLSEPTIAELRDYLRHYPGGEKVVFEPWSREHIELL